jgi:hypothetical protein
VSGAEPELVVEARLEDPGPLLPAPGDQWTIGLMRYAVLRVAAGSYSDDEIFVGHPDADTRAPEFQPGTRHRLELTRDFPAEASLLSPWDVRGRGAWFCLRFQVL